MRASGCAGRISLAVVAVYIRAMGGWIAFAFLAAGLISTEVARVAGTVWLSVWTNSTNAEGKAPHGPFYYLGVYAGISGIQVCVICSPLLEKYGEQRQER